MYTELIEGGKFDTVFKRQIIQAIPGWRLDILETFASKETVTMIITKHTTELNERGNQAADKAIIHELASKLASFEHDADEAVARVTEPYSTMTSFGAM